MPKRDGAGRKPRGEFGGMSAMITTRCTQQLRDALEAAAARSGRSISQEVERRLRDSLWEDFAKNYVKANG